VLKSSQAFPTSARQTSASAIYIYLSLLCLASQTASEPPREVKELPEAGAKIRDFYLDRPTVPTTVSLSLCLFVCTCPMYFLSFSRRAASSFPGTSLRASPSEVSSLPRTRRRRILPPPPSPSPPPLPGFLGRGRERSVSRGTLPFE